MTTYFTKNPLGSTSPFDLFDNAQNFDVAANSITEAIWKDRFGKDRKTYWGMEQQFSAQLLSQEKRFDLFIQNSGYHVIGDYVDGPLTINEYNQLIRYDGELWKLTAATDIPFTTTGNDADSWMNDSGHFVAVGDAALRQQISAPDGAEKYPELQIARWRDEGDVRGWGAKGDGTTDDTAAFQSALAAGKYEVNVPSAWGPVVKSQYLITQTLVIPDGVTLRGSGVGYDKQHPTTLIFRGTGTKQFTVSGATSASLANPSVGNAYLADSGTRGNTYSTTDFTEAFSAAVVLGKYSSLVNMGVIPYLEGIEGYLDSSNLNVSDSWDVGVWARNASGCRISYCTIQGHWRKSGLLLSSSNIGDGQIPACERCHIEFSSFEGMYGVSIRSPHEAQPTSNYGFAGTDFINCYIRGFWHQSGHLATSSKLSEPQPRPSGCLEIDGYVGPTVKIRGVQFTDCTLMNRDDILFYLDRCSEAAFIGCYFESQPPAVNGVQLAAGLGSRLISTNDTTAVKMIAHSLYGIDVTPYFSVPDVSMTAVSGNSRYLVAGVAVDGIWNPSTAVMDDWQQPFYSGSVTWRMRNPAQTFGVRDPGNALNWYVSAAGGMFHTNYQRSLDDTFNLYRTVSGNAQALLRCYASGNGEWGTGTARTSVTFKFDSNVLPISSASLNIGSNALPWSNVYSQNAVTVVSDENFKSDIQPLPEALIEAIGAVPFKMWKLKSAISVKGTDGARYHTGVIAQQVKEAITAAGLDWTKYGLITHEETSVVVILNTEGNYVPVDVENTTIEINTDGYIDMIEGADSVSSSNDGSIVFTRSKYMMRMEEFFVIRMAYLESKLNSL
ncbi:tail fiber domain-containing protein [Kluyvera ascorbata]|uniref:tail fiber domain-containing protein n=1 Tax=Kluyvera ascorbata TaxID=51288 RepID=UPI0039F7281E